MKKILRLEEFYSWHDSLSQLYSSTSKGAQPKWKDIEAGTYLKQDMHGTESLSEWVVFNILNECSNISKERLVPYTLCYIDDVEGCYSKEFKRDDEDEITLDRICNLLDINLDRESRRADPKERLKIIEDVFQNYCGNNFDYELKLMFAVDAFFLNEDRHTSNISVLEGSSSYRLSPIFDNGLSLLSRLEFYPEYIPLTKNIDKAKPVLLSTKFKKHVELYDYEPFLYKDKIKEFINDYREDLGRVFYILKYQLEKDFMQKLFVNNENKINKSSIFS